MSLSLKPLLWKYYEKTENDDVWPKRSIGGALVFIQKTQKYVLIGGNFNAFENANKNVQLNRDILAGIDKNIENFNKLDKEKRTYLTDSVYNNNQSLKTIDVYIYEISPERKWYKVASSGRVPKARSFHRCIEINGYVFCFGGVELGSKGENASLNELYVFNPETYEWKLIICDKCPYDRCDFSWVRLDKTALLYGGAASPSEWYHDDMWAFKYDDFEFSSESKKEIQRDYWSEVNQSGVKPGKIRAYAWEYSVVDCCLYLFGGQDSAGKNKNEIYKFDIKKSFWEIVKTKGKPPGERCYHEMSLINKDNILVFGGILGSLSKIDFMYNDVFLFNITEAIWVEPVIGGIQPSPRFGFGFICNYDFAKMEIMIFGGYSKDTENNSTKNMKIYCVAENDIDSKHFWNIRDSKYKEEPNDEHFLIQSEQNIQEYKEKIDLLEMEIRSKEIITEDMRLQIEDFKKKIYKSHGFIDDQSQSLEEHIKDLEIQKHKIKESVAYDNKITDYKLKLKFVMQRKVQKTMEFFCSNQNLFIKYYDSLTKMLSNNVNGELDNLYSKQYLDKLKLKYNDRLINLKNKLEFLDSKEESLSSDLHRYKKLEKNVDDLFKKEIEYYKISDDSLTDI